MQTVLQFGNPSTFQEWSNFKGLLKQAKKTEKPLLKNGSCADNLVFHLTQQLQEGSLIKGLNQPEILIPAFSR
jgi:hypothetical protein